jgi:hypothetical protein
MTKPPPKLKGPKFIPGQLDIIIKLDMKGGLLNVMYKSPRDKPNEMRFWMTSFGSDYSLDDLAHRFKEVMGRFFYNHRVPKSEKVAAKRFVRHISKA